MSKRASRALQSLVYEEDYTILGNNALEYIKTDEKLYIDSDNLEVRVKPNKRQKERTITPVINVTKEEAARATLNNGAISKKTVPCPCNKCKATVYGTMISYIQLRELNKSIPFINYSCENCGHSGYRSVQSQGLSHDEFDRIYFSGNNRL